MLGARCADRWSLTRTAGRVIGERMREGSSRERLRALYSATRARTEALAAHLSPEDQQLQSMPDASPTKWHRAHTTWFFETFILEPTGAPPYSREGAYLWNSYYDAVGARHPRGERGLVSRPSAAEVGEYRRATDARMLDLLGDDVSPSLRALTLLGVAHEEQHQELILTDILHAFSRSPLQPAFTVAPARPARRIAAGASPATTFVTFAGGLHEIGRDGAGATELGSAFDFAFDNEGPRHKVWLEPFAIADRPVTVGEVKAFIRDGGYRTPSLWLSEGYALVQSAALVAPLYATVSGDAYESFTLHGRRVAHDDEPATHLSFYEADAIARYLGARLPTEAEWEVAAERVRGTGAAVGHFADDDDFRPSPVALELVESDVTRERSPVIHALYGNVWEWTRSSYAPYPRYVTPPGAVGEYNGKFMAGQMVLRGGSCLTPARHLRASYRNFWPPGTRFQMSGLRMAKDAG
jgi:ergothioneine biosynthesis protein EgtB